MFSRESASGKHTVKSVKFMKEVVISIEKNELL